jgi:chitodextrinase
VYGEPADQEAPTAPTGLTVTGRSLNSVNLAWLDSTDNIEVTGYDIYQGTTKVDTVQAGITAYTVTGLMADMAYRFTVKARDEEGNVSEASNEVKIRTSPRINVALNKSTQTDGSCSPSEAGDKAVDGTLTENSKWCSFGSEAHWLIVDLGEDTYVGEFVVKHAGSGGESTEDNTQDFTIQLSQDAEQWTTAVNVTGNTSSETTHPIASTKARYAKLLITVPTARQDDAARIYEFEVYGEPADQEAPAAPAGLTVTGRSLNSVKLAWLASNDNIGVTGYDIYQGATQVGTVQAGITAYTVTGLTADTAYRFTVKARDGEGNVSEASDEVELRTSPRINAALNKSTQTDGFCSPSEAGDKAVDGTLTENSKWCSFGSGAHWLIVDLGIETYVGEFVVKHAGSGGEGVLDNTQDFTIELSEDGEQWTTVVNVTGNTSSETTHPIASTKARYAKLLITVPTARQDDAARIYEFEVYGEPADQEAPATPLGLTVTGRNLNSVNLAWLASTDNIGVTSYDIYQGATQVGTVQAGVTAYTVTGLASDTAYRFTVKARDGEGNVSEASNEVEIRTSPRINVALNQSTQTDGFCSPSEAGDKAVDGTLTENSKWCSFGSGAHWLIVDLGIDTYVGEFAVKHAGSGGESVEDNTQDFTIELSEDGEQWITVVNVTGNTLNETTHPIASTKARYAKLLITVPTARQDDAARIYEFEVYGEPTDQEAPTAPTGLTVTGRNLNSVDLAWSPSTDNVGVKEYAIYQNNVWITSVGADRTSYMVSGLEANTNYEFAVTAIDKAGNESTKSNAVALVIDTEAPTIPTNLVLLERTSTSIKLQWTASLDNIGIASYEIYDSSILLASIDGSLNSYTVTNLEDNKNYAFTVRAKDAEGNLSEVSNAAILIENTPPSAPTLTLSNPDWSKENVTVTIIPGTDPSGIQSTEYRIGTDVMWSTYVESIVVTATGTTTLYARSIDNAGNISSEASAVVKIDKTKPSAPQNLYYQKSSSTSGQLYWAASTDNEYVAGYDIYNGETWIASTQATSYSFTGLNPNAHYFFIVKAKDIAGNVSEAGILSTPSSFWIANNTNARVSLQWEYEPDCWCNYEVYLNGEFIAEVFYYFYEIRDLQPGTSYAISVKRVVWDDNGDPNYTEMGTLDVITNSKPPTIPQNLALGTRTETSISLSWTASTDDIGVTSYDIYNGSTFLGTSLTTNYTVTPLDADTIYVFSVRAKDASGNVSEPSGSVAFDHIPPSAPSGLSVITPTKTSVSLGWTASTDNLKVTSYDVYNGSTFIGSTSTNSYTFIPLSTDTNYEFLVKARDAGGNVSSFSNSVVFNTSNITLSASFWITDISLTSVQLGWEEEPNACCGYLIYLDGVYLDYVEITGGLQYYEIPNLQPGRKYLIIITKDVWEENTGWNYIEDRGDVLVTTDTDSSPPTAPTQLIVDSHTATSVSLSWTASTDNTGVSGYDIYNISTLVGTTTTTNYTFTTLEANSIYLFSVRARDTSGNVSPYSNLVFFTTINSPPTAPANLTITSKTATSVSLSWTASTDNKGVTGYAIYNGNTYLGTSQNGTNYTVTGLTELTTYSFTVKAMDEDGNFSPASNTAIVTTLDATPPSAPTNLAVTGRTPTSVSLSWTASTDNKGVTGYAIYNENTYLGTSQTATNYTVTGLTELATYSFYVVAMDAAGNRSPASNIVITTLDETYSSAPTNLAVTVLTATSVSLTWTGPTDNSGLVSYLIYNGDTYVGTSQSATRFTLTGLTEHTSYTFKVKAIDAAGNLSPASNIVTVVIQTGTPVQYYYDASGRVDYIQLQSGQRLKYYFDANGNLLNVVLQD